jgi:hypothetical protein
VLRVLCRKKMFREEGGGMRGQSGAIDCKYSRYLWRGGGEELKDAEILGEGGGGGIHGSARFT